MAEETPSRITVSRDALRADLAEVELRLRIYFDEQLKHKADAGHVAQLGVKLDNLDRGDFTPVHKRALTEFIEEVMAEQTDRAWTRRERAMAALSASVAILTFMVSMFLTIHGVS